VVAAALALALVACAGDAADEDDGDDGDATATATATADGGGPSGDDAATVDAVFTGVVYQSTFAVDGAWPAPWAAIGGVAEATVTAGRAHLRPELSSYSLARMYLPGDEQDVDVWSPQPPVVSGADVAIRFQVAQEGDATRLRARLWPAGAVEPAAWAIDLLDATPALQGTRGGFAIDCWSIYQSGGPASAAVAIDALTIRGLE
jgi:hypothetical protein